MTYSIGDVSFFCVFNFRFPVATYVWCLTKIFHVIGLVNTIHCFKFFLYLLFGWLTASYGLLLRGQTDSPDINYYILSIFDPKVTGGLVIRLDPWAHPSAWWCLNLKRLGKATAVITTTEVLSGFKLVLLTNILNLIIRISVAFSFSHFLYVTRETVIIKDNFLIGQIFLL